MKLSFSLSSKPSSNLKKQSKTFTGAGEDSGNVAAKEFVTVFDPSKPPIGSTKDNLVIPPKANEWQPLKRMKNLDLPLQSDSAADQPLQFEIDNGNSVDPSSDSISFGLNVRQSTANSSDLNGEVQNPNPNPNPSRQIDPVLHKFKEDMERLPEHNGIDEYTDMPVEGFGAALLKGYGWYEGRGIGRNAKEDVKIVEYKRWTAKTGIGFKDELPKFSNKSEQGVKEVKNGVNVEKMDKDVPSTKEEGGKGGKGLYVGKDVRIVGGREVGMKGRILELNGDGAPVILKLARRDEEVTVRARDVAEIGSVEEERCLHKLKELKTKDEKSAKDGDRKSSSHRGSRDHRVEEMRDKGSREVTTRESKKDRKRSRDEKSLRGTDRVSWLTSHIRVRIISKDLKRGRLYLKKGEVLDVTGPTTCDVSMDETGELIQGVDQELLETALPKRGGPVLVLYGKHKGVYGKLVERDAENEAGMVQDAETHELLNVRLEQIAEYMADPSYIGY